jgi:C_GCAxxG_C_C family probable redox protein
MQEKSACPGVAADHADKAKELFTEGYNCAQSVFCAFTDVTGLDMETSAKLASSFGGGLGRLRETCGTVSAAAMVLGIVRGYSDPKDPEAKKHHYALVREFVQRFREAESSIICRELLTKANVDPQAVKAGGDPEARTAEYYKKRPCPELAWRAAQILDQMFSDFPVDRQRKF